MTFIKVADGDRITISLSSKNQRVDRAKPRPKGPIRRKKDPKYGTRRLAPSGIEIYDCGQILSGESYIDIPFSREGTLTGYPGSKPKYTFTLTDFDALEDYLFITSLDEWPSKYKKLDFENGYKLAVDIDFQNPGSTLRSAAKSGQRYNQNNVLTTGEGWSAGGMKRLPHTDFEIHGFLGFNNIPDGLSYKVTATRNYSAANIPGWLIPEKCKIFLMPRLVSIGIYFEEDLGADKDYWFALAPYSAVPRALFADRIISISPEPNRPWLNYYAVIVNNAAIFSTSDVEYMLDTFLNSDARTYKAETRDSVTTWAEIPHSSFPRSSLESNPADGLLVMASGFVDTVPLETTVEVLPGTLLAVVTSGSSAYYIWRT